MTTLICQADNVNTSGLYVSKIMKDYHESMYDQVMTKPHGSGKISTIQRLSLHYASQALCRRWTRLARCHVQHHNLKTPYFKGWCWNRHKADDQVNPLEALLIDTVRYYLRTSRPARSISDVSCM